MGTQRCDIKNILLTICVCSALSFITPNSHTAHALGFKRTHQILRGPHVCGTHTRHCCTGWQLTPNGFNCTVPFCKDRCGEGGKCISAMRCLCSDGNVKPFCDDSEKRTKRHILTKGGVFPGQCSTLRGVCHHRCHDLPNGRFECACRDGYKLLANQQSCGRRHCRRVKHHSHHGWMNSKHSYHWCEDDTRKYSHSRIFSLKDNDNKNEQKSTGEKKSSAERSFTKKTLKVKTPYNEDKEKPKRPHATKKEVSVSPSRNKMGMFSDYRKRMLTMRKNMMTKMFSKQTKDFTKSRNFGCKHCPGGLHMKSKSLDDKEQKKALNKKEEYFKEKSYPKEKENTPKKIEIYEKHAMQSVDKSFTKGSKKYESYKKLSEKDSELKWTHKNYKQVSNRKPGMKKPQKQTNAGETKSKDLRLKIQAEKKILTDYTKSHHKPPTVLNPNLKDYSEEEKLLNSKVKVKHWAKPIHKSQTSDQNTDTTIAFKKKLDYLEKQMQADQTGELVTKFPKLVSDQEKYKNTKQADAGKHGKDSHKKGKTLNPSKAGDHTEKSESAFKSSPTVKPGSNVNIRPKDKIPIETTTEKQVVYNKNPTLSKVTQNKLHLRAKMLSSMREQFMDPRMASLLKALRKQRRQQTKAVQQNTKASKSVGKALSTTNSQKKKLTDPKNIKQTEKQEKIDHSNVKQSKEDVIIAPDGVSHHNNSKKTESRKGHQEKNYSILNNKEEKKVVITENHDSEKSLPDLPTSNSPFHTKQLDKKLITRSKQNAGTETQSQLFEEKKKFQKSHLSAKLPKEIEKSTKQSSQVQKPEEKNIKDPGVEENLKLAPSDNLLPLKPNSHDDDEDSTFDSKLSVPDSVTLKKDILSKTAGGSDRSQPLQILPQTSELEPKLGKLIHQGKDESDNGSKPKESSKNTLTGTGDQTQPLKPTDNSNPETSKFVDSESKKTKLNPPEKKFRILGPKIEADYLKKLLNHKEIKSDQQLLSLLSNTDNTNKYEATAGKTIYDKSGASKQSKEKTLKKGNMMFRLEDLHTDILSSKTTGATEHVLEKTTGKDNSLVDSQNLHTDKPNLIFEKRDKETSKSNILGKGTKPLADPKETALPNLKAPKGLPQTQKPLSKNKALDLQQKESSGYSHEDSDLSKIHSPEDLASIDTKKLTTEDSPKKYSSSQKKDNTDIKDKNIDQYKDLIKPAFKSRSLPSGWSSFQQEKNFDVQKKPHMQSPSSAEFSGKTPTVINTTPDVKKPRDIVPTFKKHTKPIQNPSKNSKPLEQKLGFVEKRLDTGIIMEDEELGLPLSNREPEGSKSRLDLRLGNGRFRRPRPTQVPQVTGCRDDQCMTTKDPDLTTTLAYFNQGRRIIDPEEIKCPKGYRRALRNQYIVCEPLRGSAKEEGYRDQLCLPGEDLVELPGGRAECTASIPGPSSCGENEKMFEENGRRRCKTVIPEFHCPQGQELVALSVGQGYECKYPVVVEKRTTKTTTTTTTTSPRCPRDQHLIDTPLGPLCLPSNFATPVPGKDDDLCPSGMIPQMTSIGVICQFKAETLKQKEVTQDVKEAVTTESTQPCYPGQILIDTPEGQRCGFPPDHLITQESDSCGNDEVLVHTKDGFQCKKYDSISKDENPCPMGQQLEKRKNGIVCVYIDDVTTAVTQSNIRCANDQLLVETSAGFFCQLVNTAKVNLPSCPQETVLVKTNAGFECITLAESRLECSEGFRMVRTSSGYFCSPKDLIAETDVVGQCRPGEITLTSGKVSYCKRLEDNADLCGSGFKPRQNRDGSFVCAPTQKSLLDCPKGFRLSESKKNPQCLPLNPHVDLCKDPGFIQMFGGQVDCKAGDLSSILVPCEEGYEIDDVVENDDKVPLCKLTDYAVVVCESENASKKGVAPCKLENIKSCDVTSSSGKGCKELLEMALSGCQPQCANGGECVDDRCVCSSGFTGLACEEDINECERLPENFCENGCVNTLGSFECSCPFGSTLNSDRRSCKVIDCIPDCLNGGKCLQGVCQCPEGLSGEFCHEDIDECKEGTHHCQALCRNTFGSYGCVCPPGSRLAKDERSCVNTTCIPECQNAGRCENHRCVCPPGLYGIVCQLDVNECDQKDKNGCTHHCINTRGSYKCSCPKGFYLQLDGKTCLEKFP